jgi:hypothetical protein
VNKTRKIQYNAVYNELRRNLNNDPTIPTFYYPSSVQQQTLTCNCYANVMKKIDPTNNPSLNTPRYLKYSHMLRNYTYYGKVQYANASAGIPIKVNYLGKTEGQPGGSGTAPKNRLA